MLSPILRLGRTLARWEWPRVVAVMLAALVARLAIGWPLRAHYFENANQVLFVEIARTLAASGEYAPAPGQPTMHLPPAYPLFLAGMYRLFGPSAEVTIVAHALVGSAVAWGTYLFGRFVCGRGVAFVAAVAVALHPYLASQGAAVNEDPLLTLFLLLAVCLVLRAREGAGPITAFTAGVAAGLAVLTKSVALPFFVLVACWWAIARRRPDEPRRPTAPLLFLLAVAMTVSPWLVRNNLVFGFPSIGETSAGISLWKGNNALTFELYPENTLDTLSVHAYEQVPTSVVGEREVNRWLSDDAVRYAAGHPRETAVGGARKALLLFDWRLVPRLRGTAVVDGQGSILVPAAPRRWWEAWLYGVPYLLMLPFTVVGAVGVWRRRADTGRLLLMLITWWAIAHALLVAYTSYRAPLEPFLILLAVDGAARSWRRLHGTIGGRGENWASSRALPNV